ncbi:MAG: alpha/beta fold hydrolase [Candidatus Baldrarchaeia archaeon]
MPYARVRDINIFYETHGQGFPLVMIMGLGANKDWWPPPMISELSKKYKLILFDNRGAGRSDKPDVPYTIRMFADDTVGLMDALGIEKAHIFGVSMGGMIAQEVAINYPERVEKLILGCTTCGGKRFVPPSEEVLQSLMKVPSVPPEEAARKYIVPTLFTKEIIEKRKDLVEFFVKVYCIAPTPEHAYRRQLEAILRHDTCDRLHKIKAPTLILHGEEDVLLPPENSKILAELIPNSKLVIFKGTGHGFIAEAVDEVCKTILEFLG